MPLKVRIGSMEVELQSVEQVAELAQRLGNLPQQLSLATIVAPVPVKNGVSPTGKHGWDRETAWQFLSSLESTAKSFMGHLVVARSVSSSEMAKKIEVEPNLLGPAIRSIRSRAARLSKKPPFDVKTLPGGTGKLYQINKDFYDAASQPQAK